MIKVILYIGECLELRYTYIYNDILSQLNITTITEYSLRKAFVQVLDAIFLRNYTWPKFIAMLAFAGGLAMDCVLNGSVHYVNMIKEWTEDYIANNLADWVLMRGSWVSNLFYLLDCYYLHHCI